MSGQNSVFTCCMPAPHAANGSGTVGASAGATGNGAADDEASGGAGASTAGVRAPRCGVGSAEQAHAALASKRAIQSLRGVENKVRQHTLEPARSNPLDAQQVSRTFE